MTKRVLLIEDDPDVRALSCAVLAGAGFDVVDQPLGPSALDWISAAERLPELIVLDVQMPEMDGWTVLEHLRADQRTHSIPVLMCTVKAGDSDRRRARHGGADAYLRKPFTIDGLVTAVRGLLQRDRGVAARRGGGGS